MSSNACARQVAVRVAPRISSKSASSSHSSAPSTRRRSAARARRAASHGRRSARRARRPCTRAQQRRALDEIVARQRETAGPWASAKRCGPSARRAASSVAMRCGEPIWHTRSTWPMSMPSSSDAVATSTLSLPSRSRCSASSRFSFDRLPWCAATASSPEPLGQLVRHALGEPARVHEDERRAVRLRSARASRS